MRKEQEKGITALTVVVAVVVIIMLIIISVNTFKKRAQEEVKETQGTEQGQEYVQKLTDGSKLNVSEELQKTKKVGVLEISNIQLREVKGITTLLADVKNTSKTESPEKTVKVDILDKQGNVITRLIGPIDDIPAGGTVQLNIAVTADVANAYDFRISE